MLEALDEYDDADELVDEMFMPCPKCQSPAHELRLCRAFAGWDDTGSCKYAYASYCPKCGVGPARSTKREVIELWNGRKEQ